jgi:hypothetical protein
LLSQCVLYDSHKKEQVQRRATGWTAGVLFSAEARDFSLPALGSTQPSIQGVSGALLSGVRRPGREADLLPPLSAEVKNGGAIPPLLYSSSWRGA